MKAGWQTKSLGNVCDILDNRRKPITKCDRRAGPYPYYGATGILDYVEGYLFDEPLVLVGEDGAKWSSGDNTAFAVEGKCWVNNHAHVLRPHRSVLLDNWLIHFLVHSDLSEFVSGLTVPKLNQGSLREISLPIPPLPEQQRIVTLLDEAFDGIATARAHAEKNLQNARAIFESHLQSVFTQQGDGWISTTIENSCLLKSGTTVPVNIEKSSGDIPYVKVAEMTLPDNQDGISTSIRFLNRTDVKAGWLIPAGAVIFPKRGGAILTNKKRLALVDMCADLNIMSVIPTKKLTPEFLYFYFLTVDMRKLGTGSSIPQINNYDIAPLAIAFPESTRKQDEITKSLRSLETKCQGLEVLYKRKLIALDELKNSLLAQAFSGAL